MITRRRFIYTTGALLTSAPVALLWAKDQSACATSACAAECGPTKATTAGPYYVSNVAPAVHINTKGAQGKRMQIRGIVLGGSNGETPLANAQVEIWHCDSDGRYYPNGNGDVSEYQQEEINLRGSTKTDERGHFAFDSIVPGTYGNRRRHIHWRFVATDHVSLITQSYWSNEKGSMRDRTDFIDRDVETCRWIDFTTNSQGEAEGTFTVQLVRG